MVRYINYKGKSHPVRLSYLAFKGLKTDLKVVDMDKLKELDSDFLESLCFHGLRSGHAAEDKPFEFKREQMEFVLDECLKEFLALIPEFFPNAPEPGNVMGVSETKEEAPQQVEVKAEETNAVT